MDMLVFWHEGSLAQFSVLLLRQSTGLHQDMELLVGCVYLGTPNMVTSSKVQLCPLFAVNFTMNLFKY